MLLSTPLDRVFQRAALNCVNYDSHTSTRCTFSSLNSWQSGAGFWGKQIEHCCNISYIRYIICSCCDICWPAVLNTLREIARCTSFANSFQSNVPSCFPPSPPVLLVQDIQRSLSLFHQGQSLAQITHALVHWFNKNNVHLGLLDIELPWATLFSPSLSSYCQRQTPNQQPLGFRRAWWVLFVCVSLRDALFLLLRHLLRNLSALDRFNIGFLSLSHRKCGTASPDCPRVTIWRCPKRLQLQLHSVQKNGPMSLQQGVAIFKILPGNVQQCSLLPQLSQTSFQLFWYATSFTFPSVHAKQKSLCIWVPPRCSHGLSLDQSPPRKCPLSRLSLWRRWPAKVTPKAHSWVPP